jgi:hypothetical protein
MTQPLRFYQNTIIMEARGGSGGGQGGQLQRF